jgi:hypothetical protein
MTARTTTRAGARAKVEKTDILFAVMGAPHASDQTTTLLRLIQATSDAGGRVGVWTCGYATMLTQASLGETKPRNVLDWRGHYPSTAAIIGGLLAEHGESVHWSACRFCGEERGVTEHIPAVRVRAPFAFADHVRAATKTMFLGVI